MLDIAFVLHKIENGGKGTKPAYKFTLITPLLTIELEATSYGNQTNDFYWREKSSSLYVVQCNTTSRPIIFHRPKLYNLTGKFEQPG